MNRYSIPALFAVVLLASGPVAAQPLDQGQQADQQQATQQQATQQQQAGQPQADRQQAGSPAPQQSGTAAQDQEMRRYVVALEQMGRVEPRVNEALAQGKPVPARVLNGVPREDAEQAMLQAGLSREDFRRITERVLKDESTRRSYEQVARQQVGQPGALPTVSPR